MSKHGTNVARILAVAIAAIVCLHASLGAQLVITSPVARPAPYREDQILVLPKTGQTSALERFCAQAHVERLAGFPGLGGLQILRVPGDETAPGLITKFQQSGLVAYAEPDFLRFLNAVPNDPKYTDGTLWGLNNYGQNGGTADADIDAPEAWDVLPFASNVVVAVLDTGVRYTHEDLAANMWVNPVDGGHGFNATTGTNDVMDVQGHGTLVSGVLGAVGNNGKGVVGVAWAVQIMAGKCFTNSSSSDSLIIACMEYARTHGAEVIVAAFDGPGYSQSLSNAIYALRNDGIIFVASCGNGEAPSNVPLNVDANPRYPACYAIDNIVSVAYTDRRDGLGVLSNYGATNVALAAPGEQIYTTWSPSDNFYTGIYSGTSLAAPAVAGALALLKERFPAETHHQLIARVLNGTDPLPALAGKCRTGGRLNLRQALSPPLQLTLRSTGGQLPMELQLNAGPNRVGVVEISTNLTSWVPVFTNTTSANGTFDFTDLVGTNSPRRFYRATATP